MKPRTKAGLLVTGLVALTFAVSKLPNPTPPDQIRVHGPQMGTMLEDGKFITGGIKTWGADLDLDGDNMNDLYVVCDDQLMYHTMSRRFLTGEDSANDRMWYKNTPSILKNAKPGEYQSP
jgi:hypothetical protein